MPKTNAMAYNRRHSFDQRKPQVGGAEQKDGADHDEAIPKARGEHARGYIRRHHAEAAKPDYRGRGRRAAA